MDVNFMMKPAAKNVNVVLLFVVLGSSFTELLLS